MLMVTCLFILASFCLGVNVGLYLSPKNQEIRNREISLNNYIKKMQRELNK